MGNAYETGVEEVEDGGVGIVALRVGVLLIVLVLVIPSMPTVSCTKIISVDLRGVSCFKEFFEEVVSLTTPSTIVCFC